MVEEIYEKTVKLLEYNHDKLDALAEALLEQEVIEQDDMMRIVGLAEPVDDASDVPANQNGRHFALRSPRR